MSHDVGFFVSLLMFLKIVAYRLFISDFFYRFFKHPIRTATSKQNLQICSVLKLQAAFQKSGRSKPYTVAAVTVFVGQGTDKSDPACKLLQGIIIILII